VRIKTVFLLIFLVVLSGCTSPKFEFSSGEIKSLSAFEGQWLLINYWAVWCKPCIKEIPELNLLNEMSEMSVIGYDFDDSQGDVLINQVRKMGIQFPVVTQNPADIYQQATPSALPATMLINPQGNLVTWLYGPQTQESINNIISEVE